ncbi:MAG: hypothetical protein WCC95_14840 [Candidatus Sulfotelmatobacter sp.]
MNTLKSKPTPKGEPGDNSLFTASCVSPRRELHVVLLIEDDFQGHDARIMKLVGASAAAL